MQPDSDQILAALEALDHRWVKHPERPPDDDDGYRSLLLGGLLAISETVAWRDVGFAGHETFLGGYHQIIRGLAARDTVDSVVLWRSVLATRLWLLARQVDELVSGSDSPLSGIAVQLSTVAAELVQMTSPEVGYGDRHVALARARGDVLSLYDTAKRLRRKTRRR